MPQISFEVLKGVLNDIVFHRDHWKQRTKFFKKLLVRIEDQFLGDRRFVKNLNLLIISIAYDSTQIIEPEVQEQLVEIYPRGFALLMLIDQRIQPRRHRRKRNRMATLRRRRYRISNEALKSYYEKIKGDPVEVNRFRKYLVELQEGESKGWKLRS